MQTPTLAELLKTKKPVLVLYYAVWCPYCINFMKDWNKIVSILKQSHVHTLKVENSEINTLPPKHRGVNAFPTIVLISDKKQIPYLGERSPANILRFVREHTPIDRKDSSSANFPTQLEKSRLRITRHSI